MELRRAYLDIVAGAENQASARYVAERCQELADRPPRELTDAEIDKLWRAGFSRPEGDYTAPRRFIAAFLAKQREPQVVKFRVARNPDGVIATFQIGADGEPENRYFHSAGWEWLDADGKPQELEVRI